MIHAVLKVDGGAELTSILTVMFIAGVLRYCNNSYDTCKYESKRWDLINTYLAVVIYRWWF